MPSYLHHPNALPNSTLDPKNRATIINTVYEVFNSILGDEYTVVVEISLVSISVNLHIKGARPIYVCRIGITSLCVLNLTVINDFYQVKDVADLKSKVSAALAALKSIDVYRGSLIPLIRYVDH